MEELTLGPDGILPITEFNKKLVLLHIYECPYNYYYLLKLFERDPNLYVFEALFNTNINWYFDGFENYAHETEQEACQYMLKSAPYNNYNGKMLLCDNLTEICHYILDNKEVTT